MITIKLLVKMVSKWMLHKKLQTKKVSKLMSALSFIMLKNGHMRCDHRRIFNERVNLPEIVNPNDLYFFPLVRTTIKVPVK